MALKDIFTIIKADRYTADGREELNKAIGNVTEDVKYNIGDISQKTGLQKTANGWVTPNETKYGKVTQKNGQWGVQQKLGKGSGFIQHKNENEAKRALSHYTRGYNTTERSKQDPHSDKARQIKQWDKEVDKIKKENRADRRAEHASHFQKSKDPAQEWFEQESAYVAKHGAPAGADDIKSGPETAEEWTKREAAIKEPSKPTGKSKVEILQNKLNELKKDKNSSFEERKKVSEQLQAAKAKESKSAASVDKQKLIDSLSFDLVDTTADIEEEYNAIEHSDNSGLPDFVREQVEKEYVNKANGEKWSDEEKNIIAEEVTRRIKQNVSNDAAPRVLTGDCKIRVRKSK